MVDAANAPILAVLTRAPSGGGKTRLFASLGLPPDPRLLTALLLDTLDGAAVQGVRRVVAVTPASACDEIRALLVRLKPAPTIESMERRAVAEGDVKVMGQSEGDLGERMRTTLTALGALGAPAVALIGSDIPHIAPATIAEAFALAVRDPDTLVLGPSADGGYYLIAARRVPDVFSGIEWGSEHVLTQTERAAAARQLRVHHLAVMADVDTADDLRLAVRTGLAPRTAAWLRAYMPQLVRTE